MAPARKRTRRTGPWRAASYHAALQRMQQIHARLRAHGELQCTMEAELKERAQLLDERAQLLDEKDMVLDLREGEFGFVDSGRARMEGRQRLECEFTVRAGRIVWDLNGRSRPEWSGAGQYRNLEREEAEAK